RGHGTPNEPRGGRIEPADGTGAHVGDPHSIWSDRNPRRIRASSELNAGRDLAGVAIEANEAIADVVGSPQGIEAVGNAPNVDPGDHITNLPGGGVDDRDLVGPTVRHPQGAVAAREPGGSTDAADGFSSR